VGRQAQLVTLRQDGETTGSTPRRRYASPLMADRKNRILSEAQKLLDEAGVDGFTIRELSRRAGVAQRTLYNVFGSKEEIVASAIELHFQGLVASMALPVGGELDQMIDRGAAIVEWVIRLRRYASAMVGVFFAPNADPRIHESLVRVWRSGVGAWFHSERGRGELVRMSPGQREALAAIILNTGYANIGDWTAGRISEAEFRRRTRVNLLLICRGYLRPKARARADALIAETYGPASEGGPLTGL